MPTNRVAFQNLNSAQENDFQINVSKNTLETPQLTIASKKCKLINTFIQFSHNANNTDTVA